MTDENKQKLYKKVKSSKSKNLQKNSCLLADGKSLTILAAVSANIIADNFTNEELALLAIFITTIGDNLATIVAANALLSSEEESFFIEQAII